MAPSPVTPVRFRSNLSPRRNSSSALDDPPWQRRPQCRDVVDVASAIGAYNPVGRERDRAEAQSRRGYSSTLDEPQRHKRKRMDRVSLPAVSRVAGSQHRLTSPEPRIAASAFPLSLPFPLQVKWWLRWRMLGIGGEWSDPGIALLISAACCRNRGTGQAMFDLQPTA